MRRLLALVPVLFGAAACTVKADPGTQVSMDFTRPAGLYGLYAAPFPSDDLIRADGTIDFSSFPDPQQIGIVEAAKQMISATAHGFAQSAGVYFQVSADLDPTKLPTLAGSLDSSATVFLIGIQGGAPDYLRRYPVHVAEVANSTLFGPAHTLSVLPLQGAPLRPGTRYAAVVLRGAVDTSGHQLGRSLTMAQLAAGQRPPGLSTTVFQHYVDAIEALGRHGIAADTIAGIAVFTTDTPQAAFAAVVKDMLSRPTPVPGGFTLTATYGNFCEYTGTVPIPDYQAGTPPFSSTGGNWVFDASGKPVLQRMENASIVVTVPRTPMPAAGYPAVDFVPAGGGTALPLVDRGLVNGTQDLPGNGPATEYAKVGFAGLSIDGPEDGARNTTGNPANEDMLYFNVANPPALRDNIREAGAEVTLHAHILANLSLDVSACEGATAPGGIARFDSSHFALQGHSMGATIAPLPLVYQPLFRALIVDGAGASFIENIEFKQLPAPPLITTADIVLGYVAMPLLETDPILSVVQWAIESADSQVFARNIIQEPLNGSTPRNVLMFQGIVDHYIMPRIADALTLSLGIDLAGPAIDAGNPGYTPQDTPILDLISFSGRRQIPLPASGNFGRYTAVDTQNPGDGVEDGHEAMFQTEPPKNQYRCFLKTFAADLPPTVPQGNATSCP